MSVNRYHPKPAGGAPPATTGGEPTDPPDGTAEDWQSVPSAEEEAVVEVRWSDLCAMRDRIEELEGEVTGLRSEVRRLEAEVESTRRRNDATVDRYERLLERRTTTDTGDAPEEADDGGILAWVRRILTR
jgi:hypothetical protein